MELIPSLSRFYLLVEKDPRIGPSHISLYMALLQQWNLMGGINPIAIKRLPVMKAAKINSRFTYNKCMNDLQDFGFIIYQPSLNAFRASSVFLKEV